MIGTPGVDAELEDFGRHFLAVLESTLQKVIHGNPTWQEIPTVLSEDEQRLLFALLRTLDRELRV